MDVVEKDKCAECGVKENLGVHHVDGDHYNNSKENLKVVCNSCHLSLHKKAYWEAYRAGLETPKSNGPVGWKSKKAER